MRRRTRRKRRKKRRNKRRNKRRIKEEIKEEKEEIKEEKDEEDDKEEIVYRILMIEINDSSSTPPDSPSRFLFSTSRPPKTNPHQHPSYYE